MRINRKGIAAWLEIALLTVLVAVAAGLCGWQAAMLIRHFIGQ